MLGGGVVPGVVEPFWVGGVPPGVVDGVVPGVVLGVVELSGVGDGVVDGLVLFGEVAGAVLSGVALGVVGWSALRLRQPPSSAVVTARARASFAALDNVDGLEVDEVLMMSSFQSESIGNRLDRALARWFAVSTSC